MQTDQTPAEVGTTESTILRYRPWLYAAALYNLIWGTTTVMLPELFFRVAGMPVPNYFPLWQVLGMYVLVFAPGYWWAARYPARHSHLVLIGLLGKILGPLGFVWAAATAQLPLVFGWTILTNDLIWWPALCSTYAMPRAIPVAGPGCCRACDHPLAAPGDALVRHASVTTGPCAGRRKRIETRS